jgi:hypothetical protein
MTVHATEQGLWFDDGQSVTKVDTLPSEAVVAYNDRLYRIVRLEADAPRIVLLEYDRSGVLRSRRLDVAERVKGLSVGPGGLELHTANRTYELEFGWLGSPLVERMHASTAGLTSAGATRVALPTWAPVSLAIGFRTNATRAREESQMAMFASVGVVPERLWALGELLSPGSARVHLSGNVPAACCVGDAFVVRCTVRNVSNAILVSAPPHPVMLMYRWSRASGDAVGLRSPAPTPLPNPLLPRDSVEIDLPVLSPPHAGSHQLEIGLAGEVAQHIRASVCVHDANLPNKHA